jgi:cytochrome c-type biogenesis protein
MTSNFQYRQQKYLKIYIYRSLIYLFGGLCKNTQVPAIVINNETKIPKKKITEERLRVSINEYLANEKKATNHTTENIKRGKQSNGYININLNLPFAYSLGFLAGLSPCLMTILGFLLSFTAGTSSSTKNGMLRAMVFGLGL